MTCRELVELVTDYHEGALPQWQRVRFDEHVATCEGCRAYVAQMRTTLHVVGRLHEEDVPHDLVAAFRTWSRTARPDHPGDPGLTR